MVKQVHSAPSNWGAEMAKANSNATELYDAIAALQAKIDSLPVTTATTEYYRSFDFQYIPVGLVNDITFAATSAAQSVSTTEAGHFGVIGYKSSGTTGGAFTAGITPAMFPVGSELSVTVYFKTPPSFNTAQLMMVGSFTTATSMLNRSGLIVQNDQAFGGSVVNSAATETGGTYTLTVNTWYIAKYELLADDKFKVTLFDEAGVQLYTYTSTGTTFRGSLNTTNFGVKTQTTSSTTNVEMCRLDLLEIRAKVNSTRVKV